MPRVDDYKKALELGQEEIRNNNPRHLCRLGGAQFVENKHGSSLIKLCFKPYDNYELA